MLLLVSFAVLTLATTLEAAWYNPAWGYRKAVLINSKPDAGDCGTGTCVPAAQVNFPVLVSLASDAALAARAQDDGDDILFTAADGTTQLAHEIESFDGATGALVAAHEYHRALMAEISSGRHPRLGDAVLAAQVAYARAGLMPELLSIYHLLGDPATTIR